jgi:hypothetical protein
MTDLYRIRASWTGFAGQPGVSTFYSLGSVSAVPNLRAGFLALAQYLPNTVSIQVENVGDIIDDATGTLTGAWSVVPVLPVGGVVGGAYAAPSGFMIDWNTTTILDGHRLKGRTFFVPCAGSALDSDGSLASTPLTNIRAYAATMFAALSGDLVVWHRPRVTPARAGGHGIVTSVFVPDKVVVLRSRRD